MSEKYVYLKLTSLHGSITHYYHFFLWCINTIIIRTH